MVESCKEHHGTDGKCCKLILTRYYFKVYCDQKWSLFKYCGKGHEVISVMKI